MSRSTVMSPDEGGAPPPAARWRSRAMVVLAVLTVLLAGFLVATAQIHKGASIRKLPLESRARIFSQASAELRSICLEDYAARGPVRDHCIEEARFILRFPECGRECQAAANAVLPHAYR